MSKYQKRSKNHRLDRGQPFEPSVSEGGKGNGKRGGPKLERLMKVEFEVAGLKDSVEKHSNRIGYLEAKTSDLYYRKMEMEKNLQI
jgi:hypothetical protein